MILFALVEARTTPAPSSVMKGISWCRVCSQERSNQRFPSFLRRGQEWWRSERRYGALPFHTSHFTLLSPERSQESAPGGSTWLLYSQYKAHVLGVQRSCTHSTKPMYYRRGKHLLQSTYLPTAIYIPSSCNLHTFQLHATHLPAAIYTPSSRNLHTFQPQTAQTTFANSTPSCRGCDIFSDMVIVSVKRS